MALLLDSHLLFDNIHATTVLVDGCELTTNSIPKYSKYKELYKNNTGSFIRVLTTNNIFKLNGSNIHNQDELLVVLHTAHKVNLGSTLETGKNCEIILKHYQTHYVIIIDIRENNISSIYERCSRSFNPNRFLYHFDGGHKMIPLKEHRDTRHYSNKLYNKSFIVHTPSVGLSNPRTVNSHKKKDLNGLVLNAITSVWKPYVTDIGKDIDQHGKLVDSPKGMYIDILNILCIRLNVTIRYHNTHRPENGWSDMVKRVSFGDYDLAVTGFSHTLKRRQLSDFSIGLTKTSLRIIYRKNMAPNKWKAFLHPLRSDAWTCTLLYYMATVCVIFLLEIFLIFGKMYKISKAQSMQSAKFAFLHPLFSLMGRRYSTEPNSTSIRIAFLAISFGGIIFLRYFRP